MQALTAMCSLPRPRNPPEKPKKERRVQGRYTGDAKMGNVRKPSGERSGEVREGWGDGGWWGQHA